ALARSTSETGSATSSSLKSIALLPPGAAAICRPASLTRGTLSMIAVHFGPHLMGDSIRARDLDTAAEPAVPPAGPTSLAGGRARAAPRGRPSNRPARHRAPAPSGLPGAGRGETSVRALSKLQPLLPERVRRRIRAVDAAVVSYPASGPAVDPETLLALATACRDSERVRFDYRSH